MIESAVMLLPQPLSPTSATVSPGFTSNETPSTAFTRPMDVLMWVLRPRTASRSAIERLLQRFHMVVEMPDDRRFRELGIFLEKSVHDLVVLAHRIVEPARQLQRENARPAHLLAHLVDHAVEPLVAGDFRDEAVKTAVRFEVSGGIPAFARVLKVLVQLAQPLDFFGARAVDGEARRKPFENARDRIIILDLGDRRLADDYLIVR